MPSRSAANKAASSPPVPARISTMAEESSAASFGSSWNLQLAVELFQSIFEFGALFLRQVAHFAVAAGIGDQRFGVLDLLLRLSDRRAPSRSRAQSSACSRESLTNCRAGCARRHLAFDRGKAVEQTLQLGGGNHYFVMAKLDQASRDICKMGAAWVAASRAAMATARLRAALCLPLPRAASISAAFFSQSSTTCSTRSSLSSL